MEVAEVEVGKEECGEVPLLDGCDQPAGQIIQHQGKHSGQGWLTGRVQSFCKWLPTRALATEESKYMDQVLVAV